MKAGTLILITDGLDGLRDKLTADVDGDRKEKEEVIVLFRILRSFAIGKAGGQMLVTRKFVKRR